VSKATGQILGHADEADGIEEYDNPLPDWWLGLFWLTIVWAALYGGWYHFVGRVSQEKKLAAEVAEAEKKWPKKELDAASLDLGPAAVSAGKEIFAANCVGCHGANLEGGIGPSLVDTTWIHGGSKANILATITNGVTEKGMPNWGQMIGQEKVAKVAAYVISSNGHVTE
jgi:cytochrome c oxidase cbb3-type subunit 3